MSTFLKSELQVVTQNGDRKSETSKNCAQEIETMMLLKMLALGQRQIDTGKTRTASQAIANVRTLADN
uniref:hypothetical protein n=1 Tax=Salinibius halmophilus TaxID=1853216 RepID=UPI000E66BE68|nr:hypothetical protein [Salinibius halmophilus]